ncbi:MAG: nuclear transport factor 2 family protein [Bacteroidetes bacterium]|nr:nuclear transport factor 2 family protein [Bacteroidota bacterium]
MKTTDQIAARLVELCRENKFVEAYHELYGEEAESIDPLYGNQPLSKGLINLVEREKQFLAKAEIKQITVSEPMVSGSHFAITIDMEFIHEDRGYINTGELCVYHVKDGKIVSQQFFMG